MLQSRRISKWNRAVLKVSSPPVLMTIPEEDACRTDWSSTEFMRYNEFLDIVFLVAKERSDRGLHPFERVSELDEMARQHARKMAMSRSVFHSVKDVQALQIKLDAPDVGENITRGDAVYKMHEETMLSPQSVNRANILSGHFDEFGSATAFGKDGKIYCCQVFRKK